MAKAKPAASPVVAKIVGSARDMQQKIVAGRKPSMKFPLRSLSNVRYTPKKGYFEMLGKKKERTLTVSTVKTFAQTMRMIALSKQLIETGDYATKRDAYYQTKNWDDARCDEQVESDTLMDDIEGLFEVHKELLHFTPDEHGGLVAGELVVIDRDMGTGKVQEIDCTKFGSGAYGIPSAVDDLGFRTKAKFILAIETGGIFERLNRHRFWEKADCILVSMAGVPTRAVRRFVRRLADEKKIPVYVFVDCDPYGIGNIYRTLKVGSGNNAHLNEFFCVPQARFLGRDTAGHRRLRPAHPPAQGRGHQAGQGRSQERPVLQVLPGVGEGARAAAQDGQARRAAGLRQVRPELRHGQVPPRQARAPGEVPPLRRRTVMTPKKTKKDEKKAKKAKSKVKEKTGHKPTKKTAAPSVKAPMKTAPAKAGPSKKPVAPPSKVKKEEKAAESHPVKAPTPGDKAQKKAPPAIPQPVPLKGVAPRPEATPVPGGPKPEAIKGKKEKGKEKLRKSARRSSLLNRRGPDGQLFQPGDLLIPGGAQKLEEIFYMLRGAVASEHGGIEESITEILAKQPEGTVVVRADLEKQRDGLVARFIGGAIDPFLPPRKEAKRSFAGVIERAKLRRREIGGFLRGLDQGRTETSHMDSHGEASLQSLMEWAARLELLADADEPENADYAKLHRGLDDFDSLTEALIIDVERTLSRLRDRQRAR